MPPAARTSWDWLQLASLGEQLRNNNSLAAQRDQIISMTSDLINGKVDVWLQEKIFRLPDWNQKKIFPSQPTGDGMKQAIKAGKLITKNNKTKSSPSSLTYASILLADHGIPLGALQVTRPRGPAYSKEELNLLQGLAQISSVKLITSHRVAV